MKKAIGESKRTRNRLTTRKPQMPALNVLLDRAARGEAVYVVRGDHKFLIQSVEPIEPIPLRPPGYFEMDEEDVALDRKFAKANVLPRSADVQ